MCTPIDVRETRDYVIKRNGRRDASRVSRFVISAIDGVTETRVACSPASASFLVRQTFNARARARARLTARGQKRSPALGERRQSDRKGPKLAGLPLMNLLERKENTVLTKVTRSIRRRRRRRKRRTKRAPARIRQRARRIAALLLNGRGRHLTPGEVTAQNFCAGVDNSRDARKK